MKDIFRIKIDFALARRRADEIDEIADDLAKIAKKDMENSMRGLMGCWRGDSANQYLAKSDRLQGEINKTANELRSIASNVRATARRIYEAEMEALRIAQTRLGGGGGGGGGGSGF